MQSIRACQFFFLQLKFLFFERQIIPFTLYAFYKQCIQPHFQEFGNRGCVFFFLPPLVNGAQWHAQFTMITASECRPVCHPTLMWVWHPLALTIAYTVYKGDFNDNPRGPGCVGQWGSCWRLCRTGVIKTGCIETLMPIMCSLQGYSREGYNSGGLDWFHNPQT